MKRSTSVNIMTGLIIVGGLSAAVWATSAAATWVASDTPQRQAAPTVTPNVEPAPVVTPTIETEPPAPEATQPVKRFKTVEAYFSDGNPNPLSHRRGLRNYERDVSEKTKKEVKKRDGGCCLVCGSTYRLEVDHRIALMNGGGNSKSNLGTLCDSCHNTKTRLDYKIRKQRRKEAATR